MKRKVNEDECRSHSFIIPFSDCTKHINYDLNCVNFPLYYVLIHPARRYFWVKCAHVK